MTAEDIDRVVEIERLAALDPIDYDVARVEAAKRLGVRASVLDHAVSKKAPLDSITTRTTAKAAP
jgi:hypothetical protein